MNSKLLKLKKIIDDNWKCDISWIESGASFFKNGTLWARKDCDNGEIVIELKKNEWVYNLSIFWKSPFDDEKVGMNCVSHSQMKKVDWSTINEKLKEAEQKIESKMTEMIKALEK